VWRVSVLVSSQLLSADPCCLPFWIVVTYLTGCCFFFVFFLVDPQTFCLFFRVPKRPSGCFDTGNIPVPTPGRCQTGALDLSFKKGDGILAQKVAAMAL
jgi:hypothetical protein